MKNLFLLFCIVLSIASAQAQGRLELKADVLGVFESAIGLSGEYLLLPEWGIEAGMGYQAYRFVSNDYPETVTIKYVNTHLSGRHYFKPKYGSDRFFIGAVADYYHILSRAVGKQEIENPDNTLGIGVEPGYKWITKKNILIELSGRVLYLKDVFEGKEADINVIITGKIGYRFHKK